MSSRQNSSNTSGSGGAGGAGGGGSGSGSGTNSRGSPGRHGNARRGGNGGSGSRGEHSRTSPRRDSAAARHAKPRTEAASTATAAAAAAAATATTTATATSTKPSTHSKSHKTASAEARPSTRRRHGKEATPAAAPAVPAPAPAAEKSTAAATAAATHTPASKSAAAEAGSAVAAQPSNASARGLNVSSPAFIPYQYLQQQQHQSGGAPDEDAASSLHLLSFSTATSPLLYTGGSVHGGSSVSSPLAFAASPHVMARVAAVPTVSPLLPAATPPINAADPLATGPTFAAVVARGSAASAAAAVTAPQSSHQLRGAYARATAAAAAAAASSATAPSPAATTPLMQPQPQPQHAGTAVSSAAPTPRPQSLTQPQPPRRPAREAASRGTSVPATTAAAPPVMNAPAAVYGPSVPVFHPQFIDVSTGATSMTPLALLQDAAAEAAFAEEAEASSAGGLTRRTATTSPPPRPPPLRQPRAQLDEGVPAHDAAPSRPASALATASQATQRRISASTAAALANQDAQIMRRSTSQLEVTAPVLRTSAPAPRPPSSVPAVVTAVADAHSVDVNPQETPKRRSLHVAGAGQTAPGAAAMAARMGTTTRLSCGSTASTVERLHACLASTEERTEEGWGRTGSVMGLTGSRGRSRPHGAHVDGYDDNDDDDLCDGHRSDIFTPTPTPAKVLAVEGSPFIAAAAADAPRRSETHTRGRSPSRDGLAESTASASAAAATRTSVSIGSNGAAQPHNANLQRAMMQLIAHIQTNNGSSAGRPTVTGAPANPGNSLNSSAVTPQKPTGRGGVDAASTATPQPHTTPDVERVPSARPSATKSAASRIITTIIHTPNATTSVHHTGDVNTSTAAVEKGVVRGAPTKGAQRSLASCLEAIAAPARAEQGRISFADPAARGRGFETPPAPQPRLSSPASSTSHTTAPMPVPRSQRRAPKSMVTAPTPSAAGAGAGAAAPTRHNNNSGTAAAVCAGSMPTNAANPSSAVAAAAAEVHVSLTSPGTRYAVMLEGHMSRRVTAMSATPLKSGVCVLFEEDRGIDMGRVVQCDLLSGADAAAAISTLASATSPLSRKDRPAPVLRPATAEEEYRWLYADVREAEGTLEPCREAAARLGLPVKVVAAVYQFNKAKLTFYYESPTRVDFRPLLPSLFSRFHCRIWMARMETPDMAGGVDDAAIGSATQLRV